jgi:hypothetical protein
MDVIGFLCVSLGSSTVQLHDSLGIRRTWACSKAGFSSQNDDHAWGVYYLRVCFFFMGKRTQCKGYSWRNVSCLWWEVFVAFTTRWQMFRWWRISWNGGAEVAETTVKRLYVAGIEALVNRWDKCINVVGGYFEKKMLSSGSNTTYFIFVVHLWPTYWPSLLYTHNCV